MRNVIRIFAADAKRLATNVVAIVVIIGLSVLPCLYAWFNILSNWDPYGPESTANLQVAVASDDIGVEIAGIELNVGDMIISNLEANSTIGWVFTDTSEDAVDGVHSGDYYAALVVDETFSQDIISFLGGDITNPKIVYYENEKKNAIAPKITNKVKTTVRNEVNSAFISTMAEVLMTASEHVVGVDSEGNITGAALDKLRDLDSDMNSAILILESFLSMIDSTEKLTASVKSVTEEVDSMLSTAESMAISAQAAANATSTTVQTMSDVALTSMDNIIKRLSDLSTMVTNLVNTMGGVSSNLGTSVDGILLAEGTLKDSINNAAKNHGWYVVGDDGTVTGDFSSNGEKINAAFSQLETDLKALQEAANKTDADVAAIGAAVQKDIQTCQAAITDLQTDYKVNVQPQIDTSIKSVESAVREVQSILNYNPKSINEITSTLKSYPNMLNVSKESLTHSLETAKEMEEKLSELIEDMEAVQENEQYGILVSLIQKDPAFIADFVSSPVNLEEEPVYPVENNGSATAPFYIVLSIWVGALIMSTILKTTVKDTTGLKNLKNWQCFIGRYIVTFLIGQIQTVITVLGALLYVGIQCEHPFLLWVACSWTSFVFSLLLYSFTYSFGNVGEALSVILMVIQVAGSGGTFPVQVLPMVFQYLYKFMPFAYAMNAVRECVAGFYKMNYWKDLLGLVVYVVIAFVIGILLYYPCRKLNDMIEESKEKSDLLI